MPLFVRLRSLTAGLLTAILLVGCSTQNSTSPPENTTIPATASPAHSSVATTTTAANLGPAEHDGQRALQHVEELSQTIGQRVAGTDAENRAVDYIASQFRSDGYDVEVMDFSFEGDRFRSAKVTVAGQAYEATTAADSAGGTLSAPAVFVGLADDAGIGGQDLTGKIAIADRGTLTFGQKAENVVAKGATGLIILNNQPGGVSATLSSPQQIPVVSVAGEDASPLRKAAQSGATLAIDSPNATETAAKNVIARPAKDAACKVLVGGHFDTVLSAPGANDNGSGTANVLELARAFAADGLDSGLCFATFSAEESGLFGSDALAQRMKADGALPALMLNLDVTGIGSRVEVIGDSGYVSQTLTIANDAGIPAVKSQLPANTGSDHMSFQKVGVPVIYFTSGEFDTIHSPGDVLKDIDESELDRVGDLAYATITELLPKVARG